MIRSYSRRMRATRLPRLLAPFLPEKVFMRYEIGNLACLRGFATGGRKGKRQQPGAGDGDANQLSGREIALQAAIDRIRNELGNESIMWLGRTATPRNVPVISTGSLTLDVALGIGGLPKGRVIEIYGPEASGKTTLALHVIAEAQKKGGVCVFIDAEHALDSSLAEAIGVQTNNLLVAQPDCGEHALSVTDTFVRSNSVDVIVIDSVAALVPRVELEGEMGDSHMAVLARLMSQALRKLTHSLARSQTILIFINQIRSKMQTFGSFGGASLEVTSGGNALKFYASVRLNIRKTGLVKRGEEAVGATVVVKIAKNKLAPPFKSAEFEIEFGKGIGKEGEIIDLAVSHKLMSKSGNWYSYNGKQIANGREKAKEYLKEHKDIRDQLDTILKETLMAQPERNGLDGNESEDLELLEESHEEQKMVGSP